MLFTRTTRHCNINNDRTCEKCTCNTCAIESICKLSFNNCTLCSFYDNYHTYSCKDYVSNEGNSYRN
jgi:hypothetical protein